MRIIARCVAAASLALPLTSVWAQEVDSPPQPEALEPVGEEAAAPPAPDAQKVENTPKEVIVTGTREKKVCKNVTVVGSRLPTKVCRTEIETTEERAQTQDLIQDVGLNGGPVVRQADPDSGIVGPVANPF